MAGAAVAALLLLAAPGWAATDVYPGGGGAFAGDAEGWQVTGASCNAPTFCSASGGYRGDDGRPAGSLGADTNVSLNLLSVFQSTVTLQSPDFEVGIGGAATLHLERRFSAGSLVDLSPQLDYSVQLIDRSAGKRSTSIAETIEGDGGWGGEDGAATVRAGHTYAISIRAVTTSNVVGTGLLAGSTTARFDNVALSVDGADGAGSGKGASADAPSAARLAALAPATLAGPARMKGQRLYVKARCPKKVGRACRLSVVGLMKKSRPATTRRTIKVASGKAKRLALKVRPRSKGRVVTRKRLLFKVRVRAGGTRATTFKRLRLVRR